MQELKNLLDAADTVLITSHISPDPDALSSVLLLGTTLQENYPDKQIVMALEEDPEGLDFLGGYDQIKFGNLLETTKASNPDLFVMLDAVNYERLSRSEGQSLRDYISTKNVKTAIIDHHEPAGKDNTDVYIYQGSIAAAQDVYEVCFDHLKLKKPKDYGEATIVGIYSDSGGFTYDNPRHRQTFKIVSDLIDEGVSIEEVKNKLSQYSPDHMQVIAQLSENIGVKNSHTLSFLADGFVRHWQKSGKSMAILNTAVGIFANNYIRNIDGRLWGYVVYLDPRAGEATYSVSLRSQGDAKDVSVIANKLGGGGHKPAAGAKVQAQNIDEAVAKVEAAISNP